MPETLLTPTTIKLFGRVVRDLAISRPTPIPNPNYPLRGDNNFLQQQIIDTTSQFARIYGFSYEGTYYDLPRPSIFLVHGIGASLTRNPQDRTNLDQMGVMARDWELSAPDPLAPAASPISGRISAAAPISERISAAGPISAAAPTFAAGASPRKKIPALRSAAFKGLINSSQEGRDERAPPLTGLRPPRRLSHRMRSLSSSSPTNWKPSRS
jgi:hypothetical protein